MPKHLSSDLKLKAVHHYINTSKNYAETAEIFTIPATSLKRWVERYKSIGDLKRLNPERTAYKVTTEHVKEALKQIKQTQSISMKDLNNKLEDKFEDYNITSQWLGNVLRDNNQTRKRSRHKHEPKTRFKKPIDLKEEAKVFYSKVSEFNLDDIICLDETSVSPFMLKAYSRCKLGKRCITTTTNNIVFRKFTLLVAVSSKGVVGYTLYQEGGVTGERLDEFIKKYISDKYKKKLIIMDNAGAHKKDFIKETIQKDTNTLLYSIPYHPRANAIENVFSELKHHLSSGTTRTYDELEKEIKRIFDKVIPKDHYMQYFKYAYDKKNDFIYQKNKSTRERTPPKYKNT
jgi:transposase/transposase-like protein